MWGKALRNEDMNNFKSCEKKFLCEKLLKISSLSEELKSKTSEASFKMSELDFPALVLTRSDPVSYFCLRPSAKDQGIT